MNLPHFGAARLRSAFAVATLAIAATIAAPASAAPITILFVGNSFTYGDPAGGPNLVRPYKSNTVTDLVGTNIGGVPALFKAMTVAAGLDYAVSLETQGGTGLDFHYNNRLPLINRAWDHVVLQSFSTLNASQPGNPASLIQYSGLLANLLHAQNPNVSIHLDATWSRADQTYPTTGFWYGQEIGAMGRDVRNGYNLAAASNPYIEDVIQVGQAWSRAWETGLADSNPYNGISPGLINLWAPDAYHASVWGYYLEALMFFGQITDLNPLSLGYDQVARDLGITAAQAFALQTLAFQTIQGIPEPGSVALVLLGALGLYASRRAASRSRSTRR